MITITAFREKIRKKTFSISAAIGVFVLMLFSSDSTTVSINGVSVTSYETLTPILLTMINAISCMLAVIFSLGTIPNEYERRTSHLIWIRGISQASYHGQLAAANVLSALLSQLILYVMIIYYMLRQHHSADLWKLLPAFLISAICVICTSLMTSWLSIFLPRAAAGVLSTLVLIVGILHSVLDLAKNILGGFSERMISFLLFFLPDFNAIQSQAGSLLIDNHVAVHPLLKGVFYSYLFFLLLLMVRRKEA